MTESLYAVTLYDTSVAGRDDDDMRLVDILVGEADASRIERIGELVDDFGWDFSINIQPVGRGTVEDAHAILALAEEIVDASPCDVAEIESSNLEILAVADLARSPSGRVCRA